MERLRIGIVGTSGYVDRVHLPCIASHRRVAITALCGRQQERVFALAQKYGIPGVFTDFTEMLTESRLDAILIATPDDLHHPMTLAALDAGLHVLCEKPLAINALQAREMRDLAESLHLKNMVFFRWRWLPHYEQLRKLIATGWVGRPLRWTFRFMGTYGLRAGYTWRFDEQRATGVLGDLGSHMIDLARWLSGEIGSITADLATLIERFDPNGRRVLKGNDSATLLVHFTGGSQGMIQVSAVAELGEEYQEQSVVVHGEEGRLEVSFPRTTGPVLRGARGGQPLAQLAVADDIPGEGESYDNRLLRAWTTRSVADRLFVDAILDDLPLTPSFDDGVKVQEVIDAAFESYQRDEWITLAK
jgi:predicted dehydrogenase